VKREEKKKGGPFFPLREKGIKFARKFPRGINNQPDQEKNHWKRKDIRGGKKKVTYGPLLWSGKGKGGGRGRPPADKLYL